MQYKETMVSIRKLQQQDANTSWQWRNDPEIWIFTGSAPDKYITVEMEHDWIKTILNRTNEERFAILFMNRYVGNIYLTSIDKREAELHYFLGDKSLWGKGIVYQAVILILEFARKELNLKRIFAVINKENIGSIKMILKNGFREYEDSGCKVTMEYIFKK